MSSFTSGQEKRMHSKLLFARDILIIALSIAVAVFSVRSGLLSSVLSATSGYFFLEAFVAGMFFTSVFTTAPALVALSYLSQGHPIFLVAFIGALGSVIGDIVIFQFVKDEFSEHLLEVVESRKFKRRLRIIQRFKLFRWFSFLLAGLIIASPFPDELGISLLGFSKQKLSVFIPFSYTFNFLGILVIGLIAQSIL